MCIFFSSFISNVGSPDAHWNAKNSMSTMTKLHRREKSAMFPIVVFHRYFYLHSFIACVDLSVVILACTESYLRRLYVCGLHFSKKKSLHFCSLLPLLWLNGCVPKQNRTTETKNNESNFIIYMNSHYLYRRRINNNNSQTWFYLCWLCWSRMNNVHAQKCSIFAW